MIRVVGPAEWRGDRPDGSPQVPVLVTLDDVHAYSKVIRRSLVVDRTALLS